VLSAVGLAFDLVGAAVLVFGLFRPALPLTYGGWKRTVHESASDAGFGVAGSRVARHGLRASVVSVLSSLRGATVSPVLSPPRLFRYRAVPTAPLLSKRGQPLAHALIARILGEDAFEVLARHPFLPLDEVVGGSLGESEVTNLGGA
jgi:hypothetical protein